MGYKVSGTSLLIHRAVKKTKFDLNIIMQLLKRNTDNKMAMGFLTREGIEDVLDGKAPTIIEFFALAEILEIEYASVDILKKSITKLKGGNY